MRTSSIVPIAVVLAACSWKGKQIFCESDAKCPSGYLCEKLKSSDEEGVCIADWQVTLDFTGSQPVLGPQPIPVTATLTLGSGALVAPETVDVLAGGEPAGVLARNESAGLTVTYSGTFKLPAGLDGAIELQASVARNTIDEARSAVESADADTVAPQVTDVVVTCAASPCLRDSNLMVTATVTDHHQGTAAVSVDANDYAKPMPMNVAQNGTSYSVEVSLATWGFPFMEHAVTVKVTGTDALGNVGEGMGAQTIDVTRRRWVYDAATAAGSPGVAVTSPAVETDGTLVVGLAATSKQLLAVTTSGSAAWTYTLAAITSAPSVGNEAIWVGGDDGRLYAVKLDGSGPVTGISTCGTTAAHVFTPVVSPAPSGFIGEVAYAGTDAGRLLGLQPAGTTPCYSQYTSATAITAGLAMNNGSVKVVFVPTTNGANGFLELYEPSSDLARLMPVTPTHQLNAGTSTVVPPVVLLDGSAVVASGDGMLWQAKYGTSWSPAQLGSVALSESPTALVVASNGDLVIGAESGLIHRLTSTGSVVTGWPVTLDNASNVTGIALAPATDDAAAAIYATTATGDLYALNRNGAVIWKGALGGTLDSLDFPTISSVTGTGRNPVLYAGSSTGMLYAVIVDAALDPSAPWPAAHHDARNSGNAGP